MAAVLACAALTSACAENATAAGPVAQGTTNGTGAPRWHGGHGRHGGHGHGGHGGHGHGGEASPTPSSPVSPTGEPSTGPTTGPTAGPSAPGATPTPSITPSITPPASGGPGVPGGVRRTYPWHRNVVATTFWVGEEFDPSASDGSQVLSAYDDAWMGSFGGCDGVVSGGRCATEARNAANGWFPTRMTPRENPFYLDLPFDDVNDEDAFAARGTVVPWAGDPGYAGRAADPSVSFMKNRWVRLQRAGHTCYGQIQDAGPAVYDDATYVFGTNDARPASRKFNGAGADVSPALNGCLGFGELDGQSDRVDWQFVEAADVPAGPWTRVVTTSGVNQ